MTVDGIVTLRPLFWSISISGDTDEQRLLGFALDIRQRGMIDLADVGARLEDVPRVAGRRRLERVLRRRAVDGSDSVFESRARARLLAAGLAPSAAPVPAPMIDDRTIHVDPRRHRVPRRTGRDRVHRLRGARLTRPARP